MIRRYTSVLAEILRESWARHPAATAGLLAAKAARAATAPVLALALRAAIDGIIGGDRGTAITGAAVAALVVALATYLGDVDRVLDKMIVDRIAALHLRPRIEHDIAHLDGLAHLERTDLLDRVTVLRGAAWRLAITAWTAVAAVFDVLKLVLLLALLGAAVSPWLLVLLPFAAAPLWAESRGERAVTAAETATAEAVRLQRHLFNLATEPGGGKEIRVTGAAAEIAARQRAAWTEATAVRFRARLRAAGWKLAGWALFTAGFGAGLALVVDRTAHGHGTTGDLVLAVTVAATLRESLQAVLFGVSEAMSGRALVEPYRWLRDYSAAARARGGDRAAPASLRDGIALAGVKFTYPGTDAPALDGVDCHLPAGAVVAIVGEYGSGKTTLVKLLARLYEPDAGRITVDDVELGELDAAGWRARCAAAFQDFGRFPIRVGHAVGLGDLAYLDDEERVRGAIAAADATGLIDRMPGGLDTQLGRRFGGVEPSEGQWQKIALARASMRAEPLLFMLDEPTASLDAPSEHAIFTRYMARARELGARTGAVTVVVSHRFSTVADADLIVVLHRGRVVEQGTHAELLAADGRYADLYRVQADAYATA